MATLEGQTIAASYKDLLQVSNSNSGVDATARAVSDGEGTATLLYLSTTEVYSPGTGGTSNTAFGKNAGDALTTNGNYNVFIGEEAGSAMASGTNNIAIGYGAFDAADAGEDDCIAIGLNALGNLNHASSVRNIAIGSGSGDGMGTLAGSTDNIFIGYDAGGGTWATAVSTTNVGIGNYVMDAAMNGSLQNVGIGHQALTALTEGDYNVAIGTNAGAGLTTGDQNVVIGQGTAGGTLTGNLNTAVGDSSLSALTGGANNVAVGATALNAVADTESDNVAIGYLAMGLCDQGAHGDSDIDENVAIGSNALKGGDIGDSEANVTGNVAIGYNAMDGTNTRSATGNTFVGQGSGGGTYTATVANNVGIGDGALSGALAAGADGTVAIGKSALAALTSGEHNIAIGLDAALSITTGDNNVAIGYAAFDAADGAESENMAIGVGALGDLNHDSAARNIAIGNYAGNGMTTVGAHADNMFIGHDAGGGTWTNTDSAKNLAIGNYAMDAAMNGAYNNVAVGYGALSALTTGDSNTVFGFEAGKAIQDVDSNTLIGYQAGVTASTGMNQSVAVGYKSLYTNNNTSNTAIGWQAAEDFIGQYSTFVGHNAGINSTSSNTCVAIGSSAMGSGVTTGNDNTILGANAGTDLTSGHSNIFIGTGAGATSTSSTTGDSNIIIGKGARQSGVGVDVEIIIGTEVTGGGTETTRMGISTDYITNDFGENATWTHSSDERIKKDIEDNELGLDFINDLRTVTFKKKAPSEYPKEFGQYDASKTERNKPNRISYGFIAQEVKKAMDKAGHSEFPVWSEDKDGMQELGETEFITPLIKAVQELSQQVEDLKAKIN